MSARVSCRPAARRRECGSVSVVVVAGAAIVLVLTMGVADVARVLTAAARARAAADAAALAAAQELAFPSGETPAAVAAAYAAANRGELLSCSCDPGTFEGRVQVRVPVGELFLFADGEAATANARAVVDLPSP